MGTPTSVKLGFGSSLPAGVSAGSINEATVNIRNDDTADLLVLPSSLDIDEGDSATFTVKLATQPTQSVSVSVASGDAGAATVSQASLSFSTTTWNDAQTVTVSGENDADGNDESLTVSLEASSGDAGYNSKTASVSVSITDDDTAGVTVHPASLAVDEGGSATYTVVLDTEPTGEVTVTIEDPTDNTDVTAEPASLVFTARNWSTAQTVTATAAQDDDAGDETATITHTVAGYGTVTAADDVTVAVADDAPDSLAVSFERGSYTVDEGSTVMVKVKLDADPERSVTIPITKANQGGASDSDYSGVPANVTFNSGDTEAEIAFSATQDTVDDDGESVKLTFGSSLPTGVTKGSTNEAIVSITDDDVPSVEVSFGQGSYPVDEGSTVMVKVKLDADPERSVTIPITKANQGGASDSDYSGVPANVTFNSGDTEAEIAFSATQDTVDDDGESVKLGFGSSLPAGVSAGSINEATVNIRNDDTADLLVLPSSLDIDEGDSATFTVKLATQPTQSVSVSVASGDAGAATVSQASLSFSTTTWNDAQTVTVSGENDADGNDESLTVSLEASSGDAGYNSKTASVSVSITDDDTAGVTVHPASLAVDEGGSATYTVVLDTEPTGEVTVTIEDPTDNTDVTAEPASLVFTASDWSTAQTVTATAAQDDDAGDETATITHTVAGYGTVTTADDVTVAVADDAPDSLAVSFERGSYTVDEGSTVMVKVVLDADPERSVTIPIMRTNQGGASDSDYSGVPANVTFNSGDTEAEIAFSATQDTVDDDGESVKLGFGSSLPAGVSAGSINEATVNITDDDDAIAQPLTSVLVSFGGSDFSVPEGSSVEVTINLSADPERTVTIPVTRDNQDGTTDSDYSVEPGSVTFNSGETEQSITFTATDDDVDDDGESVKLGFGSSLPAGVSAGSINEATVNIRNDDTADLLVLPSSLDIDEGDSATFTVKLATQPTQSVSVSVASGDAGAVTVSQASLSFSTTTWNDAQTVTVSGENDADGNDESLTVSLEASSGDAGYNSKTASVSVSITDDDTAGVTVHPASLAVDEGGSATYTVVLDTEPTGEVTVTIEDPTDNTDVTAEPASLVFTASDWDTAQTVTATAAQDDDAGDETATITHTVAGYGTVTTAADVTVAVADDAPDSLKASFERGFYTVDEGHGVDVMVKLDSAPDHRMDIQLQKTNMNGASDSDYSGIPSMLTFERGETEKSFTFFAEPDNESDDGETVMVSFAALPAMVQKGDPSEATMKLRDNGSPSEDGITCIDNNRANIVTVLSARGEISSPGEIDSLVIPDVDPYRTYFVEILGADSNVDIWGQNVGGGSLTLADPHPVSLSNEESEGTSETSGFTPGSSDGGTGRNARFIFIFDKFGDYVLKVKSGDENGTGSYHLLVRYDNYCITRDDGSILFQYEGGPEGYAFDIRDDTGTRYQPYDRDRGPSYYASGRHVLGDNWGSMPDEDWIRLNLEMDTEYEVYLEGDPDVPVKHQLTRPRIVGIYDVDGVEVHEGAAASGTDTSVSLTFQPTYSGDHYLAVGSNPGDRTGLYSFYVQQTGSDSAGRATANNSPTGGPGIIGLPRAGEILTATTSGIADADGLENASFSYQWVRHDQATNTDTDIQGATGPTYPVTREDRDRAIKVRVDFTDDGGNHETLTSFALLVLPPVNTPATGPPSISGTAQVGQTLTADTSVIADADGLDNVAYSYQWIRNDGTSDTDILDATDSTHTLAAADEGQTIKVRVSFTDDADNEETLTSAATDEVAAGAPTDPPGRPRNLTGTANPDGTVTLSWDAPNDDSVTGYQILRRRPGEGEQTLLVHVNDTGSTATEYTDNDVAPDVRHAYRVKAINALGLSRQSNFVSVTPTQPAEPVQNSTATGTPRISGTLQVDETLTADTSGISDTDGLTNVSYSYQWVVSDGGADLDITGATDSTYTLVAVDQGLTIKVKVSFTDDAGNGETLTSATMAAVEAAPTSNSPATGAPTISGTVQVGETLRAHTSGIADDDGLNNDSYSYQWVRNGGTDIQNATGSSYALVDADEGRTIKVEVNFTDDAGNEESLTSAVTAAVAARPNTPATGVPTINGTAQVGETLAADTSAIADADGLSGATYSYQWLGDDVAIQGATDSSYTLAGSDAGKAMKVKVSFTDDAGNAESLTSVATNEVTNAGPTEPPGAPENLTAVENADGSVTLTWDAPGDDSVTGYRILRRNADAGEASVSSYVPDTGSDATSYTDTDVAANTNYVYRVRAINEAGVGRRSGRVEITTRE